MGDSVYQEDDALAIKEELPDRLMEGVEKPGDLLGDKGLPQESK